MNQIFKAARLEKSALTDSELALINQQTLRTFTADELFLFRLVACDNQPDRDHEVFSDSALDGLAQLFPGRPVLLDHNWSAKSQTARVYAASVESDGEIRRLVLRCYLPRMDATAETITRIESGILREVSVGVSVQRVICSVCGADQLRGYCNHIPGHHYDGILCTMTLDGAADAYEVSLVPVPCQPGAGIVKSKRYGDAATPHDPVPTPWQDKALLELEKNRY